MKLNRTQVLSILVLMFIGVQVIGLATGYQYLSMIESGAAEPALPEPSNPLNSVFLLAYILAVTGIIILIVKYKKKLLTVIEALAIFFASDIVFELLIPVGIPIPNLGLLPIGVILALALVIIHLKKRTYLTQNIALLFAVSGAGAVLGASLGVLPVLIFMLILGVYDFVSVFYTKHMVYMAKAITETPRAFTAAFPTETKGFTSHVESKDVEEERDRTDEGQMKEYSHTFQLGGGDLAIPLVFSVSLLRIGILPALFASFGSMIALILLFSYLLRRPGVALPALPPVSAGAVLGFLISVLVV